MLGFLNHARDVAPRPAERLAASVVKRARIIGTSAAILAGLIWCAPCGRAQQPPTTFGQGEPRAIVNPAKSAPASCTGEWHLLTKVGSRAWRWPGDWVDFDLAVVRKSGIASMTVKPANGRLKPGPPVTISVEGKLTHPCRAGYFRLSPESTLELKRNSGVKVTRSGPASGILDVRSALFRLFVGEVYPRTYDVGDDGAFEGGSFHGECCIAGPFLLEVVAGRNVGEIKFKDSGSTTIIKTCEAGGHFGISRITGRLLDPEGDGHYRLVVRKGRSPAGTTRVCMVDLKIKGQSRPRILLGPAPAGFAGRWLVNANGYVFLVDIRKKGSKVSGSFRGITNRDSSVSTLSGSVSGDRIQFVRSRAEGRHHPPQPYTGRLITAKRGRWVVGTFQHLGRTYDWCAVDEELVKLPDRSKWRDCTVGGRPAR